MANDYGLGEYLSAFSGIGSVPTSLSGYGFGQRVHNLELEALESNAPNPTAKPASKTQASVVTAQTSAIQAVLVGLGFPATGLTDSQFGKTTKAVWQKAAATKAPTPLNPFIDGAVGSRTVSVNSETYGVLSSISQAAIEQKKLSQQPTSAPAPAPAAPKTQAQVIGAEPKIYIDGKGRVWDKLPSGTQGTPLPRMAVPVRDVQLHLDSLLANPSRSESWDAQTKAAWSKYASVFKEPRPEATVATGSSKWVWINADAMSRLRARGNAAAVGGGAKPAAKQSTASGAKTAPSAGSPSPLTPTVAAGDLVANTGDVQSLLKRLGWTDSALKNTFGAKPGALDDSVFGPTTQKAWEQSARKRKLATNISKKTADGKQVTVREATYLQLKAVADALVPPAVTPNAPAQPAGGSLLSLNPAGLTYVTVDQLGTVLGRITGAKSNASTRLDTLYAQVAKSLNVDPRIESVPPDKVVVLKDAWTVIMAKYDAMAPAPAPLPPGPQKSDQDQKVAEIIRASTSSVPVNTVRVALNAVIASGKLQHPPFPETGVWENSLTEPLLDAFSAKTEDRGYLTAALVRGKLISKDGKTLKLPKRLVDIVVALAKDYKTKQTAAVTSLAGYTKVNPAELIAKINGLNVSTVIFNRNGGAKELADAIRTFFDTTKTSAPSGDVVKQVKQDIFVNNDTLTVLAAAVKDAEARAAATQNYRAGIVAGALKDSSASVSILDVQQAVAETVRSGKAGADKKLYATVKQTGAFDKATRAAYTQIAKTLTVGPQIVQAGLLLKQQLGPNFKAAMQTELGNKVWGEFLDQAVSGKTLKTMPLLAKMISDAAASYQQTAAGKQATVAVAQAQTAALTDAVNKSTKVISILNVQQALLQMIANKEIDAISGLAITGTTDKPTRDGLFWVSGLIFPEGYKLAETTWASYLQSVGLVVVSDSNVSKGWSGANYIALPPPLADLLLKRAGEYVFGHGPSQVQVARFSKASVATAQAPAATPSAEPAAAASTAAPTAAPPAEQAPATAPAPAYAPPEAAAPTAAAPAPTASAPAAAGPAPQVLDFSTQEATAQPTAPLPPPEAPTAAAPAPDAAPAPAAAAPETGSGTGLWIFGGVAALAALVALKGKDKNAVKTGAKKPQTRYAR